MAQDEKPKRRLGLGVSTKLENAWYVSPDLLAGDGEGAEAPRPGGDDVVDKNPTVALGLDELEEAAGELADEDEDARHYRQVSLKGALLDPEDARGASGAEPPPPPPAPARRSGSRPGVLGDLVATLVREVPVLLGGLARELPRLFEPGRVPPAVLALAAFLLGVGLTLLGVLLAL